MRHMSCVGVRRRRRRRQQRATACGVRRRRRSSGLVPRIVRGLISERIFCGIVFEDIHYDKVRYIGPTRGFVPTLQNVHFFHFCESARMIIFANLQVFGAKKENCAETQICSMHKWRSGTLFMTKTLWCLLCSLRVRAVVPLAVRGTGRIRLLRKRCPPQHPRCSSPQEDCHAVINLLLNVVM